MEVIILKNLNKRKFIKFLLDNNLLWIYKKETHRGFRAAKYNKRHYGKSDSWSKLFNLDYPDFYITSAFDWEKSLLGKEKWNIIDNSWRKIFR